MRRVTLFEPNGRRVDLTPRTPRERIARGLSLTLALIVSLAIWALVFWSLVPRPAAAQSNSDIANAIIRECAAIYHATGYPCVRVSRRSHAKRKPVRRAQRVQQTGRCFAAMLRQVRDAAGDR